MRNRIRFGSGNVGVPLVDRQLDFGGAPHRLDRAGELGDDAVAGAPEDAALMVGDQPVDDLTMGLQRRKRRLLILAHEPAVADHIGCKDGSHSALNAIHGHARPRGTSSAILRYKPADREARKTSGAVIRRAMAALTYRNSDDERADKAQQERLLAALDAWDRALRRDENAAWIIRGKHGTICTWGDPQRSASAVYAQPVSTVDAEGSARAWVSAKHKLAVLTVTQDGDSEGVFRLDRLPTADEAVLIREVLGIRKRVELSLEELERRRALLVALARRQSERLPRQRASLGAPQRV